MQPTVFIQTNNKQLFGARIAKYAIESKAGSNVEIMNVDEIDIFKNFIGTVYTYVEGDERIYTNTDLQSFTLSRFMTPELMGYEGIAVVIDPDIFALTNIEELFSFDLKGHAIAACPKKDAWDTSVMLLNCAKLTHWNIRTFLAALHDRALTYRELMDLRKETSITPLPRIWNHLDEYTEETKMIHMTGRLTQPWKTGLPIDFTRNKMKTILGIIPREPIYKLLGRYPTHYAPHPNRQIENLFFDVVKKALKDGVVNESDIKKEIGLGNIRPDFMVKLG